MESNYINLKISFFYKNLKIKFNPTLYWQYLLNYQKLND